MVDLNRACRVKEPMEKELYAKMEEKLIDIFEYYRKYNPGHSQKADMVTAQTALALMTLKRDFTPAE